MTGVGCVRNSFRVKVTNPDKSGYETWPVELEYSDIRQYEIHMHLGDGRHWKFARDLLKDGARQHGIAGLMDVQVWNDGVSRLFLKLVSPYGEATLEFPLGQVRQFLAATRRVVAYGKEEMDMDLIIAQIFKKEGVE